MYSTLAYADSGDPNSMNLALVLGGAIGLGVIAALAAVLIVISRARDYRRTELVMAAAFWWAVIAAGSLLYAIVSQINWSKEYMIRLEAPNFDPREMSDAPRLPWGLWTGLGAAYVAMLLWLLSRKPPVPPGE
jgi:hypothetical protein